MRGLNASLATVSTNIAAPVIAAQRLRRGSADSPRVVGRPASDALALVRRTRLAGRVVLVRAELACYSHALVTPIQKAGALVSVKVQMGKAVKCTIATIPDAA